MLVGIGRVVLLGDVVTEDQIGQRLEAVGVAAGNVDRDGIVVADVLAEDFPAHAVEHNHPRRPVETDEEVVLAALVEVQAPNRPGPREGHVGLDRRLRQRAFAPDLDEPAALVLETAQGNAHETLRHASRLTPFARTKSFTS